MKHLRNSIVYSLLVLSSVGLLVWAGVAAFNAVANRPVEPPASDVPNVVAGAFAGGSGAPVAPAPAAYDGLLARGAAVYAANCFSCHGGDGDGKGPWSANLQPPARDFTDTGWMSSQADGVLFTSIQRGVAGSAMPSFAGRLSELDTWSVVAYLRGFSPTRVLDSGSAAPAAGMGREVYEAQCAGCHGVAGGGDGPAAASFAVPPRALSANGWLAGVSDQRLIDTMRAGVPGTPMPSFDHELTTEQMRAVVDYLRVLADGAYKPNPLSGWARENYQAYCASCHGVQGNGKGVASGRLSPAPRDFRNPTWMAGQSDERLRNVISSGRPGTAMPPFRAILEPDEIARLAEYVRAFAGEKAIPGASSAYRYDPNMVDNPQMTDGTPATAPAPRSPSGGEGK